MSEYPQVSFSLAMASLSGSPPFPTLLFDDGAAVSLHSVSALAVDLGLNLPRGGVFELVQDWGRAYPALVELVNVLAYEDRARGHRNHFVAGDLLTMERLLPEARQIIRLDEGGARVLLPTVQVGANASIKLDEGMRSARPNLCLGVVIGQICRNVDAVAAGAAIAGWTLATELVRIDERDFARCSAPGSLVVGPVLVPARIAGDLAGLEYVLALMATPVARGRLGDLATGVAARIAALSRDAMLLPGDIVVLGNDVSGTLPSAMEFDTLEAAATGFGRQTVSLH